MVLVIVRVRSENMVSQAVKIVHLGEEGSARPDRWLKLIIENGLGGAAPSQQTREGKASPDPMGTRYYGCENCLSVRQIPGVVPFET